MAILVDHFGVVRVLVEKIQQDVAEPRVGPLPFQHHREIVRHRQLHRQPPREAMFGRPVRRLRSDERIDEHVRREQRAPQPRENGRRG